MRIRHNRYRRFIKPLHFTVKRSSVVFSTLYAATALLFSLYRSSSEWICDKAFRSVCNTRGFLLVNFVQSFDSDIAIRIEPTWIENYFLLNSTQSTWAVLTVGDVDNMILHTCVVCNMNWRVTSCSNWANVFDVSRIAHSFQILMSFVVSW